MPADRGESHPISSTNVQKAVEACQEDDSSGELSAEKLDSVLTDFQEQLQSEIGEITRARQDEGSWDSLEERLNAYSYFYLNTYDYFLIECFSFAPLEAMGAYFHDREDILENRSLQSAILKAHRLEFDSLVERRDLRRITGQAPLPHNPVVIRKTYPMIGAEDAAYFDTEILLKAGLSPAETLDYIYAEHMYSGRPSSWAKTRGVSTQAVSQNVKNAKRKLKQEFRD